MKNLKLTTIYSVYDEENGEAEAMFTVDGELLHYWWGNDANWRHEYFAPFMAKLGYNVVSSYGLPIHNELLKKFRDATEFNLDSDE